jgi:two-component system OmpR family response regulator
VQEQAPMTGSPKVLIIDDSEVSLAITAGALRKGGIEVMTLIGPLGAAQAIAKFQPDLVLLDIDMPALSGDKVAMFLKRQRGTKGVRVVLYSDRHVAELVKAVSKSGADGFLQKGKDLDLLFSEVWRLSRA